MTTSLPANVQKDLENGYVLTDIDDGYQRCRKVSDTVFKFKSDVVNPQGNDGEIIPVIDGLAKGEIFTVYEEIDVSSYGDSQLLEVAELGYGSLEDLRDEYGEDANQILAELLFEQEVPAGTISASLLDK